MKKLIIYSPGAYQAYGHSHDYSKGLSESFHELGYEVYVFGRTGPLIFPDFVNEVKTELSSNNKNNRNLIGKVKMGIFKVTFANKILKEFIKFYRSFEDKPLVLFETFEYFTLSHNIQHFSGNYYCIYHDTNFNFQQTSLIAGVYKFFARFPSRKIVKHSKKTFVHGAEMKKNFTSQMGKLYIKKIEEIPYGAPLPCNLNAEDKSLAKKALGLKADMKYLLSFGTIRSDKEYLPIIEALKKTSSWEWIIAGPEGDLSYDKIMTLAMPYEIVHKIISFPRFIKNEEQKQYFMASELVVNLYKPFIRHESGTAQLARTYNKPVLVSGPPDLTDYVVNKKIGWVADDTLKVEEILKNYEEMSDSEKESMFSNIKTLAMENSWESVVKRILSFN